MSDELPAAEEFPTLSKEKRDAVALAQKQLHEGFDSLDAHIRELNAEHKRRKTTAVVLKVVSVLSGTVIATGFLTGSTVQVIGGIVPAIAGLERVFANLSRLLSVAAAKNAYERIRRQTVAIHRKRIVPVVEIRDSDPDGARQLLIKVAGEIRDKLAETEDEIEAKLAKNDYDNLGRLTLEDDGSAAPKSP